MLETGRNLVCRWLKRCLAEKKDERRKVKKAGFINRFRLGTAAYFEDGQSDELRTENSGREKRYQEYSSTGENTRLVIDDTTIYEVDLECERRRGKRR